jgi:5'-nucleotidase/UDP-sugar diphosphatase
MKKIYHFLSISSLALLSTSCANFQSHRPNTDAAPFSNGLAVQDLGPAGQFVKDKSYRITVLHNNDNHGRFWKNEDGEYGMAARATLIQAIRAEVTAQGGNVLLLDAGDPNTGVPESDTQNAEPDFKAMNAMGYQAMAVGNHEFDKPISVLKQQINLAKFPVLSANITQEGKYLFSPYTIFNLQGVKVAVMGLTTPDTAKLVFPENVKNIVFNNPIQTAQKLVPTLKQKADVIIAATHLGYYENGKGGSQAAGDVELARAVSGIDLIVGGHSHTLVCMKAPNQLDTSFQPGQKCQPDQQNNTTIVQAGEWGKYLGRADFEFKNGQFQLINYQLIPVNLKKKIKDEAGKESKVFATQEIKESPEILALLEPYQSKGDQLLSQAVGQLKGQLDGSREKVRVQATNMGEFVAAAMKEKTKADFAIMNSGGVRASLSEGTITYRDLLKVQPFGNTIAYIELTGQQAFVLLQTAVKMTPGSGAFPQFSGIELLIENNQIKSAMVGGQVLSLDKTYRIAMNNFMASGGDGYPNFKKHPSYVDTGFVDADVLKEVFAKGLVNASRFDPQNKIIRR